MSDDRIDVGELARQQSKHVRKAREDADQSAWDESVRHAIEKYIKVLNVDAVPEWVITAASRGEHSLVAYDIHFNRSNGHSGEIYTPFCSSCGSDSATETPGRHSQGKPCEPRRHHDKEVLRIPDGAPEYRVLVEALKAVHARIVEKVNERVNHVYVLTRYTSDCAFKIKLFWGDAYPSLAFHSDKIKRVVSRGKVSIIAGTYETTYCV